MSYPSILRRLTKAVVNGKVNIASADIDFASEYLIRGGYCDSPDGSRHFFDCVDLAKDFYKAHTSNALKLRNIVNSMLVLPTFMNQVDMAISTGSAIDFTHLTGIDSFVPANVVLDVVIFT